MRARLEVLSGTLTVVPPLQPALCGRQSEPWTGRRSGPAVFSLLVVALGTTSSLLGVYYAQRAAREQAG
jgi:hypothetical protein